MRRAAPCGIVLVIAANRDWPSWAMSGTRATLTAPATLNTARQANMAKNPPAALSAAA